MMPNCRVGLFETIHPLFLDAASEGTVSSREFLQPCRISVWGHVVITFGSAEDDQITRLGILGSGIS